MKKILLSILMCGILVNLVCCGQQNEAVKAETQVIVDAFEDGDMETIKKTIFGINEVEIDEGISDIWGREYSISEWSISLYFGFCYC